jgi:hypothetical protein
MTIDFTLERAKSFLTKINNLISELQDGLGEGRYDVNGFFQELENVVNLVDQESNLVEGKAETFTDMAVYDPALSECSVFLRKIDKESSKGEILSHLYDAKFSIRYYLDQLNT